LAPGDSQVSMSVHDLHSETRLHRLSWGMLTRLCWPWM